jgi:hypothetical protein
VSANRKKLTNNFTVPVDRKYGIIILLCLLIGKKFTNNFIVSANRKKWSDNIIVPAKRKKLTILLCLQIGKKIDWCLQSEKIDWQFYFACKSQKMD